jgi:hypothetical protein
MTRTKLILFGAVAGLAWAGALRGYMIAIAGGASAFHWVGTFAQILLPGAIIGALLGWAEFMRRTGGRPRWRLLALSPLLFTVAPLLTPGALWALLTTGIGGGALAVSLTGIGGGFALSRRGPLWARVLVGVPVVLLAAAGAATPIFAGPVLERGVWAGLLWAALAVLLVLACSIPFRAVAPAGEPVSERTRTADLSP